MATHFGRGTWLLLGAFVLGVVLSCGGGDDRSGDGTSAAPANDIGISPGPARESSARDPSRRVVCPTPIRPAALRHRGRAASVPTQLPACPGGSRQRGSRHRPVRTFRRRQQPPPPPRPLSRPPTSPPRCWRPWRRSRWWAWHGPRTVACSSGRRTASSGSSSRACCCRRPSSISAPRSTPSTIAASGDWPFIRTSPANGYVYLSYVFEGGGNPNDQSAEDLAPDPRHGEPIEPRRRAARQRSRRCSALSAPPPAARSLPGADCIPADGGSHTLGSLQFARGRQALRRQRRWAATAMPFRCAPRTSTATAARSCASTTTARRRPTTPSTTARTRSARKSGCTGSGIPSAYDLHPASGDIYFGDVGWNTWEEVDRGQRGANYGWPCYEGAGLQPFFQSFRAVPAAARRRPSRRRSTPTTAASAPPRSAAPSTPARLYPTEYRGNFFFADYVGNWIQRVVVDARRRPLSIQPFATNVAAPRDGQDGPGRDALLPVIHDRPDQSHPVQRHPGRWRRPRRPMGTRRSSVAFSSAGSIRLRRRVA